MKTTIIALMAFLGLGDVWKADFETEATHNGKAAKLVRYHKSENRHFYGEHLSFVFDTNGKLLGFVHMDKNHDDKHLPSKEEAQKIALLFLQKFSPDLLPNMKILWIDKHEEFLQINEKKQILMGMKVKCQDKKNGLYFWTIIDGKGKVFVFEREIEWITFPGKRGTEKFLHDGWLDKTYKGRLPLRQEQP